MLQFLSCRRWFEVILRHTYYVMSCVRPQLGGGGADCFHTKWAVDSSYLWNVHCFQIRWRICHSVGIGIKGSLGNWVNAAAGDKNRCEPIILQFKPVILRYSITRNHHWKLTPKEVLAKGTILPKASPFCHLQPVHW